MNLTERLERKGKEDAERYADEVDSRDDLITYRTTTQVYQAGHSSTHAILVELAESLKIIASPVYDPKRYGSKTHVAETGLAKLEKYLGEK